MKITYIIDSLGSGGKERQLSYLLRKLSVDNDIQLIIFSEEIFYKEVLRLPIKVHVFSKQKKYKIKTIFQLYKLLKSHQPEIVHSWEILATVIILPYKIFNSKIKLVSSIRFAGKIKKKLALKVLYKIIYAFSSIVLSNSRQGLLVERLNDKSKGKVIYNGLDISRFDTETKNVNARLPIPSSKHMVAMLANFSPAKDYATFIKSAKSICKWNNDICFICIGDGGNRTKAERLAGEFLNKTIFFVGSRNDISAILKKSTIGVLLNNTNGHAEGISNAIMEYMAAELPVIATNAGGTPELVQNNISGFLVPAFNEGIVAEKILYLTNNRNKAKEMGKAGRDIIEKDFSLKQMTESYREVYEGLINEK